MTEDISVQLIAQASDNINKLYDLVIRIDERLVAVKETQEGFDGQMTDLSKSYNTAIQRLASLRSIIENARSNHKTHTDDLIECHRMLNEIDKRLSTLESNNTSNQSRWNKVISFAIQLLWVILAAWLLTKLNLQSPAIP